MAQNAQRRSQPDASLSGATGPPSRRRRSDGRARRRGRAGRRRGRCAGCCRADRAERQQLAPVAGRVATGPARRRAPTAGGWTGRRRSRSRAPRRPRAAGRRAPRRSARPGTRPRRPWPRCRAAASRVSIESFFAEATKPQVLTTATSAVSPSSTRVQPAASSRPASSSESTSLRAQPSVDERDASGRTTVSRVRAPRRRPRGSGAGQAVRCADEAQHRADRAGGDDPGRPQRTPTAPALPTSSRTEAGSVKVRAAEPCASTPSNSVRSPACTGSSWCRWTALTTSEAPAAARGVLGRAGAGAAAQAGDGGWRQARHPCRFHGVAAGGRTDTQQRGGEHRGGAGRRQPPARGAPLGAGGPRQRQRPGAQGAGGLLGRTTAGGALPVPARSWAASSGAGSAPAPPQRGAQVAARVDRSPAAVGASRLQVAQDARAASGWRRRRPRCSGRRFTGRAHGRGRGRSAHRARGPLRAVRRDPTLGVAKRDGRGGRK